MRIHVVSDVHGRADALPAAARDAGVLICLGDLLPFMDYAGHRGGIVADLFGAQEARTFMALRRAQRFNEARALFARLSARLAARLRGGSVRAAMEKAAARQYTELFAALPQPAYGCPMSSSGRGTLEGKN